MEHKNTDYCKRQVLKHGKIWVIRCRLTVGSSPLTSHRSVIHKNGATDYTYKENLRKRHRLQNHKVYLQQTAPKRTKKTRAKRGRVEQARCDINTRTRFGHHLSVVKAWKSLARLTSEYPLVARVLSVTAFSILYTFLSLSQPLLNIPEEEKG